MVLKGASVMLATLLAGCATSLERGATSDFSQADRATATDARPTEMPRSGRSFDGTLASYIARALEQSPELRATFEDWRAATFRIAQARRLPEPIFTYAYFVRSVETRVGPQRHKFGISQAFPWPTKLSAGADAASLAARSARQSYEAAALEVARTVAEAYWKLWVIQRTREVEQDQQRLLQQLSASARARVEIGQSSLADLGQIDLSVSRITDVLSGLDEAERVAQAELLRAVGEDPGTATPIANSAPRLMRVAEGATELRAAALSHPRIQAIGTMAESQQQHARAAGADRYPGFVVGAEYIETGPARMAGVADSGKDPIIVSLAVKLPIWGGVYPDEQDEALAQSAAYRARQGAAQDRAEAALEKALSDVRDSIRRVELYRQTLVPQAQTVFESVLGGYQAGTSTVASTLLAERELLELQLSLFKAQGDYGVALARLEALVGRPVRMEQVR
jgi:cobalt-zinc-cadmium efflux system outer membrane protein